MDHQAIAQEEMYKLTEEYIVLSAGEKELSTKLDKLMEKRRALWYEFPTIDLLPRKK